MNKKTYTPHEVSEMTGVKLQTLANWRYLGKGPHFVKIGGCVRYPARVIDELIA